MHDTSVDLKLVHNIFMDLMHEIFIDLDLVHNVFMDRMHNTILNMVWCITHF